MSFGGAALLAAALLYYSLRGIEWREVARVMARASPARLAMVVALGTVTLVLRACRWRLLLNAEGAVSLPTVFWATAAGYFGNNFLPARAGELVRTFMISSRSALDGAYVLATALSERVADAVVLVAISAIVLLILPAQSGWLARAARPFAVLGLLGVLGIAIVPLLESVVRSAIERLPLPPALRLRVTESMAHALRGMRAFHDLRRLSGFMALTAVIWSVDAVGLVVTGSAIGLRLPILVAFLLMTSLGLSSALPSMPGYVGIYQFVAVTVLTPFGFSRTDAIAYILVSQALGYVVIGVWGSIGLWRYRRTRAAILDMTGKP